METLTIHQKEQFPVSPQKFYEAFLSSEIHGEITGPSTISLEVGGSFEAGDGFCHGENLELIPGKKIVQSWIARAENWPAEHESKITLNLSPSLDGVELDFVHELVPADAAESYRQGWIDFYWKPFREYFEQK